ncbi:MAG TPA: hypothetical protein VFM39_08810 [bacterium]|nr:hypothetical protein [bacterium]
MTLPPEIRSRILEEEQIRVDANERFKEEIRLRERSAGLFTRVILLLLLFATGLTASEFYRRSQVQDVAVPSQAATPRVSQVILDEIADALKPPAGAGACVRATSGVRPQIKATIEMVRETSLETARRTALANARAMGAILQRHGLLVSAYVEVFSPKRWYGLALYDSDKLRVSWDVCPGRCNEQGTLRVRHCEP